MTDAPIAPLDSAPAPSPKPRWKEVISASQFLLALAATLAFLAWLLFAPHAPTPETTAAPAMGNDVVEVTGPGLIRVKPGSPFDPKVQIASVRRQRLTDPIMMVTGRVAASLRPGMAKGNDFWQFDTPEALTAFTDWQRGQADIGFTEMQLASVKQLAAARLDAQRQVVARLEKLVAAGTDTVKDLAAEKANLLQAEITGRKETYEAETAIRTARRTEAAAAKQLQQAGLDPDLLKSATSDMDIVLADVPEGRLNRVKVGQGCKAMFFGLSHESFSGKVTSIAPVLSKERRTLRVLFVIHDPNDQLRPGMFAEIGLGTDPRDSLLVPADGVLHIGRSDYMLVGVGADTWRVAEVHVGEPQNGEVEILGGLKDGNRIVGKGAILFKPVVIRALQPPAEARP